MLLETEFQIPTEALDPNQPTCAAVTRCCDQWNRTLKTETQKGESLGTALRRARNAYRNSMPPLVGHDNIRDFIACVAQGVLCGAIPDAQSSRLLYAAQIAQVTLRQQPGQNPTA